MKFHPRRLPPRSTVFLQLDTAPATSPAPAGASSSAVRRRRMAWLWLRRTTYSPVEGAELQGTTAPRAGASAEEEKGKGDKEPRRRRGWLRRLVYGEHALRRRWTLSGGASSRLAAGLRWTRVSSVLSARGGGGCASALLDAVAFRVVYVVEAVVLGLALSCFF